MSRGDLCPKKRCRAVLAIRTDGNGGIIAVCEPCRRNKAGYCRRCPTKFTGKVKTFRMYCDACDREMDRLRHEKARRRDPEHHLRLKRESDKRVGEAVIEKRRERRRRRYYEKEREPSNVFYRAYKRAWSRKFYADPVNNARLKVRRKRWLSDPAVRERYNAQQRARYHAKKARTQAIHHQKAA